MATDCGVAPFAATRAGDAFLVQELRDVARRHAVSIELIDATDDTRLNGVDLPQTLDAIAIGVALL
ncbi:hypothetical protein [Agrobacterium pusense]|uniref:hypothetical protein n=1 Tax=Agrobacterium pusense TaxID=648995 RepID=UPI002449A460|nr:hypothetical protein [Agrobacterium pusense]MDH0871328.1 hypothetical protein [Agrobacterium pusense]